MANNPIFISYGARNTSLIYIETEHLIAKYNRHIYDFSKLCRITSQTKNFTTIP